jgi:hypothetical protein
VTTATFEPLPPFELELELEAPPLLPEDRADELRLRDEAADAPRLEALALFGLLRDAEDLLFEDPLRLLPLEALLFFGLDPFEPREAVCRLLDERVLPWAIAPP